MTRQNPYSYVTSGGVENARVKVAEDATLADLVAAHATPVQLDVASIEYHNADKKTRTSIKKALPYFVGGVIKGRRHDTHVQQRTLITLDIERHGEQVAEPPQPQDVVAKLEELGAEGWVYTSLSHTPKAPRYRVVLPLGKPLEVDTVEQAQATLKATTVQAADKLGLKEWCTPESYVLSQAMYLPAKLRNGKFYSQYTEGKAWGIKQAAKEKKPDAPADIPDDKPDLVLHAIKQAGLYLNENPRHKGMHFITCPFVGQHGAENETQTVYYEAHYDGNPRPAVKCFDTEPDHDGQPHLTYTKLVRWLREHEWLTQDEQESVGVLDDYDTFDAKANLDNVLDREPVAREWAIDRFAPVGKVTVLAGPGGVSKSMLMLHVLIHASTGRDWGGFRVDDPLRSLYVSYEDDQQELAKRVHTLAATLQAEDSGTFDLLYDVAGSIRKNVRMFAADDEAASWLMLTKPDRFGQPERTERVDWLIGYLKAKAIRMVVLDPAVYTHQLEENDIADMAVYMQTLTYIAKQARCAVVVLHHMNKTGGWSQLDEINQGSLRGASSFADNARSVGVVVSMSIRDAESYGLPAEHATTGKYAVFKHVKHNYSAPMDTMVFERKGGTLVPRPDITKLDRGQLQEAREQAKEQENERRVLQWVERVLATLAEAGDALSLNQLAVELNTRTNRLKPVLAYCEEQDWVEAEVGPNRAHLHTITKLGKSYLRGLGKRS
jgi:RecA-family ATPase